MKTMWCWRCQMELPMLDEEEFAIISRLYVSALEKIKDDRKRHAASLEETPMARILAPVCVAYTKLTGFEETNANAVMHHRLSLYGPPCEACGKPLRTPEAGFCAECGQRRG